MRKLVIFTFIISMLATSIDCIAQGKAFIYGVRAIGKSPRWGTIGAIGKEVFDATAYQHTPPVQVPSVARHSEYGQLVVPLQKNEQEHQSGKSIKDFKIKRLPRPAELEKLQRRSQEAKAAAKLQKAKVQLKKEYQELCVEIEQETLCDTLALVRIGNRAVELKCDSMAVNCFTQFISRRPSTEKIAIAVDSLMNSSQVIASIIIDEDIKYKFCKYWENPNSVKISISDFEILAKLGDKYNCLKTDVAQGMLQYFGGNFNKASGWFEKAARHVLIQSKECGFDGNRGSNRYDEVILSQPENELLFSVTAFCMDQAQYYPDMLTLFGDEELDRHIAKIPYLTFLLYKAALFTEPDKTMKYADMGISANEEYFNEQFQDLYNAIYADFLENPQSLTNLDFLTAGLDSNSLSQSYIDMACKLSEKLSDTPDGMEHYYDESLLPYREALLEIANRSDSLHKGQLTPDNVSVRLIAEDIRMGFLSSAEQGRANLKVLYEQLYNKHNNPEFYLAIVASGVSYSAGLSYQKPKEALKVMKKVLPIIKKLDALDANPFETEYMAELYKYMADLYSKNNKPKESEKMRKLADKYIIVVE